MGLTQYSQKHLRDVEACVSLVVRETWASAWSGAFENLIQAPKSVLRTLPLVSEALGAGTPFLHSAATRALDPGGQE